ncbi:uncharacterized protein LOC116179973 [Photinus pyralis]|uniref:uncharacterized protein LOC116179973 n=1 Tax=Photinus pyralis TaxID=7054 RepID=UPI0012670FCD|nr:uncharacterized protein LOC116179973 [Photinus pyralis]
MRFLLVQIFYYVLVTEYIQATGLKWVRVNVPQYRSPGESAQLLCDYDLGNDTLYSIKWYKDHEEFYRFVPMARPQATSYKMEGIFVDMGLSDRKKVVLRTVNLKSSGLYRCEVSAEAPSFSSAQSEARMEVVSHNLERRRIYIRINFALFTYVEEIAYCCSAGFKPKSFQ